MHLCINYVFVCMTFMVGTSVCVYLYVFMCIVRMRVVICIKVYIYVRLVFYICVCRNFMPIMFRMIGGKNQKRMNTTNRHRPDLQVQKTMCQRK